MLITLPQADGTAPLYLRLINKIKQQIHSGEITAGEKMPSLRHLADDLGVSRTTAEAAYNQLVAEGYLLAEPKRRRRLPACRAKARLFCRRYRRPPHGGS